MNEVITILHQYTIYEYVMFTVSYALIVILFIFLSTVIPKIYTVKNSMLSMVLVFAPLIYIVTQILVNYFTKTVIPFINPLLITYLITSVFLVLTYFFNESSKLKVFMFSLLFPLMIVPLILTNIFAPIMFLPYVVSHIFVSLLIISLSARYHA